MGCDPPRELLEAFLEKMRTSDGNVDFILVPGDLVAHGIPLDPADPSKGDYKLL